MNICGIYMIFNSVNSRVYIGSSINIKRRIGRHFTELKHNNHKNIHLQRFVNKYGIETVDWKLIDVCKEEELLIKETKRINEHDSILKGFNLATPDRHYFTDSHKKNMSKARINSKTNKKIEVLKNEKVIMTGLIEKISKKLNLDRSSIYKILKGKRKTHKGYNFKLI